MLNKIQFDIARWENGVFLQASFVVPTWDDVPNELLVFASQNEDGEIWIGDVPLSMLI